MSTESGQLPQIPTQTSTPTSTPAQTLPQPRTSPQDNPMTQLSATVITALRHHGLHIATAESLTGGALCAQLVDIPGASETLLGGVCTYTNEQKIRILELDTQLLDTHGAVHPEVGREMARAAQRLFGADLAISTTGVAGPGPADGHPAGTVYIACALGDYVTVSQHQFTGSRNHVRAQTIHHAINLIVATLEKCGYPCKPGEELASD